ncbi:MAG: hypothetical protein OQK24_12710 [Magnetovibrio sp.]|nr:hypothetical protein [Magnetovibrio sp.]
MTNTNEFDKKIKISLLTVWLKKGGINQKDFVADLHEYNTNAERPFSDSLLSSWKNPTKPAFPNKNNIDIIERYLNDRFSIGCSFFDQDITDFVKVLGFDEAEYFQLRAEFESAFSNNNETDEAFSPILLQLPTFINIGLDPLRTEEAASAMRGSWLFAHYAEARPHDKFNKSTDHNNQKQPLGRQVRCCVVTYGDIKQSGMIETEFHGVSTKWKGETFAVGPSGFIYTFLGESEEHDEVNITILRQLTRRSAEVTSGMKLSIVHPTGSGGPKIGSSKCMAIRLEDNELNSDKILEICDYYPIPDFRSKFPKAAHYLDEIDNTVTDEDGVYALLH